MPAKVSSRSGVRVLLIFGVLWWMYGGYVWLSNARAPSRTPAATLTSRVRMLVSWVIAKTKTRSKNSSRVLTRSGRSPGCSGWLTALARHRRAAMSRRYQPPRSETVPASS